MRRRPIAVSADSLSDVVRAVGTREFKLSVRKRVFASFIALSMVASSPASAETIFGALAKAYQYNSSLNSARAGVRVTDENVPLAKSTMRPQIDATIDSGYGNTWRRNRTIRSGSASIGVELRQLIFDGFQTRNNIAAAKANVRAANQTLSNTEQTTLLNAATAFMDVIRDRQVAALTEQNLAFLNEQVRAANARLEAGEGTRTDVAQADAERANAVALVADARAQLAISAATYRQIIGADPGRLSAASALSRMLPKSVDGALSIAEAEHPGILARKHLVDASGYSVKSAEGALLPQVGVTAGVSRDYQSTVGSGIATQDGSDWSTSASIGAQITIPIYQGGGASARVRQSKEELGQARIDVDVTRDEVRQAVSSAWHTYIAASQGVRAGRTVVDARRLALNGVIEERNVGQRTTLDVLEAQAAVIEAQINLAADEHDVVVGSYAIVAAMGRLNAQRLGLNVSVYDPKEHYRAVKDKWHGLRTPDGR